MPEAMSNPAPILGFHVHVSLNKYLKVLTGGNMEMKRFALVVAVFCSSAICFDAPSATPTKLGLSKYEVINPTKMSDLIDFENKKVSMELIYNVVAASETMTTPDQKGYDFVPSTMYNDEWIKEAFPRDKFTLLSAAVPVVAFKKCDMALRNIKNGEKITVSGTVKKKVLRYKIKRDLYYLEIETVKTEKISSPPGLGN